MTVCRNCSRAEVDHVNGMCPTNTSFKPAVGKLGMRVHNNDGTYRDITGTDLRLLSELREILRENDKVRVTFKRL